MAEGRQYGVVSYVHGTTTGIAGIIVENATDSETVETATARDETGKVINHQAYSRAITVNANGLLNDPDAVVHAGSVVTIGGGTDAVSYLVTSAEKTESNTDFVRYAITMQNMDGCTPVAYSSTPANT